MGSFVQLKAGNGREYLGQIITKELVQREGVEISFGFDEKEKGIVPEWVAVSGNRSRLRIRALEGSGVLLGQVAGDDLVATSNVDIFQKATITPADMALVNRYMVDPARKRASLLIGHALYVDGHVPVMLDAGGLNRHTFLCGQSGAGKTFSLGIVLERLLLETDLRMVIIDPNSDFVRFDRVRPLDEVNRFHTSLMEQATKFSIGESLLAGRIVQNPTFAKFEGRLSVEGGGDIPTTWAARRELTVHPGDNGGDL